MIEVAKQTAAARLRDAAARFTERAARRRTDLRVEVAVQTGLARVVRAARLPGSSTTRAQRIRRGVGALLFGAATDERYEQREERCLE
jgi:hypothetical protein